MKHLIPIFAVLISLTSCQIKPKPINYGNESCAYCNMTIVSTQFASQIVNDKGRTYNFDAIECMVNYHHENKDQPVALYLANNFKKPGIMVNATDATFLISEKISSPMGAYLSGFETTADAENTQKEYGGTLYNWQELMTYFEKEGK